MSNVIWSSMTLPGSYFSTLFYALSGSCLLLIPASGVIAFAAGTVLAVWNRERAALWGLLSVALSHLLVAVASPLRNLLEQSDTALLAFLVFQFLLATAMIYKSQKSRLAGVLIGWFTFTYALVAAYTVAASFPHTLI